MQNDKFRHPKPSELLLILATSMTVPRTSNRCPVVFVDVTVPAYICTEGRTLDESQYGTLWLAWPARAC